MAKGYSLDVRKKALEYMEKGNWRKKQAGIWNIKMDDGKDYSYFSDLKMLHCQKNRRK
ncbi:hypothetical protein AGMMS49531_00640 [Endomicrobiia bacterium]|nr:hypothetical protein AGMMS49531_00640 [Endomicrobiia bacterium]